MLVFKNDQAKIEEGIVNALNHLSAFENTVYQAANSTAASAVHEAAPEARESSVSAAAETQPETSAPVVTEQPETIAGETVETQSAAALEPAVQPVPQESLSQSNQLDIF